MPGLWEEVKTRKIFKAATIYAAVTWGIIQIADILLPVLGIADWVMSSMVLVAFSGFPIALIFGWMLDIKLERSKLSQNSDESAAKSSLATRIAELAVISLFGIGASYLYYNSSSEPVNASIAAQPAEPSDLLASTLNKQETIAVLPFANFSDSNEDEFFADGLSEELLNVLARNKKLRVAARTSSFHYKNTNINTKTIARELGVQYILEGSVRRSGDLIRVTAQLIKADEDVHIFSKTWDRNTTDVFKVQDEIAQSVLDELKVSLLGEPGIENSEIGTHNITALAEYSRGLAFLRNRSKSDFENAIVYFNKALNTDPEYAEAMAMLAETYLLQFSYAWVEFDKALPLAKPLINKALQLNPELGAAHAVKGLMHWQIANNQRKQDKTLLSNDEQLEVAKQHLSKAIDINPSLAEAYMWYGSILQQQGDFANGAKLREKAYEIDPRAAVVGFNRAKDLIRYGNYKQAMDVFNTVVRNNPNYPSAYSIAGDVSYAVGQLDQAFSMYNRLAELSEDPTMWLINSSRIYLPLGQYQLAQNNFDKLQQVEMYKENGKFSWLQASIWIASNDLQPFYQWTESFKENTVRWDERLWRGFASIKQEQWQFAIDDLTKVLELSLKNNPKRIDEHTIRTKLLLARSYQNLGDKLKSNQFLREVKNEIAQLKQQGFDSQVIRYHQAALAANLGEEQNAIALLRQSVQEGFVDFWWAENDPAFEQLRKASEFALVRDEFSIRMQLMQNSIQSQYGSLAMGQ